MPRVLITGLNGFTGRYMAAELENHGWEVWGVGSQPADQPRYYSVDLMDAAGLHAVLSQVRPDAVVHLAGIAFVGHGEAQAFYRVNLLGTYQLLAALAQLPHTPQCVLLASSAGIYGNATGGSLKEDAPAQPANDYAVSKLAMEHMAKLWQDKLPIVIARPFNYTGVGQGASFLLPKIVAHFRQRASSIELGNLQVWRDFSDVRAVVRAYRRLIEVCPRGQTVNVCSGRVHSLGEVLEMAEQISGHHLRVDVNPAFVRANEVKILCGDAGLLRSLIGPWDSPPLGNTLRWMLEAPHA